MSLFLAVVHSTILPLEIRHVPWLNFTRGMPIIDFRPHRYAEPRLAAARSAPEFFSPQVREARRFYLDLAPPARQPLAVVCGGFECSAPDYAIDRAGFPYFSIEFVARGKGALVLSGQQVPLAAGHRVRLRSGRATPHHHRSGRSAGQVLCRFYRPPGCKIAPPIRLGAGHQRARIRPRRDPADFRRLDRERPESDASFGPGVRDLVGVSGAEDRRIVVDVGGRPDARLRHVSALPAIHPGQLSAARPAWPKSPASATWIRPICAGLFRRYDHQTPYQFLMRLKMNLAAERLQNPGVLVKQVATELRFDDPFHFSRAFKKRLRAYRPRRSGDSGEPRGR